MPKKPNPSIGECPCPICGKTSAVKRFAVRAVSPTLARRGGRLYVDCAEHGTFTSSAPAMQDWILDRAQIWGPDGKPIPAELAELPPQPAAPVPDRGAFEPSDQPIDRKKHGGWGFFA